MAKAQPGNWKRLRLGLGPSNVLKKVQNIFQNKIKNENAHPAQGAEYTIIT
jgi:hypothetical protein